MNNHGLTDVKKKLNSVGWFIPPYISYNFIVLLGTNIGKTQGSYAQDYLEQILSSIYDEERLASMVLYRYPSTPVIDQFSETISESVCAHFLGLRHVAIGGLIPVIEGAGRRLAGNRGIKEDSHIKDVFESLAASTKEEVTKRRIGAVDEIVEMMDSFLCFTKSYFYSHSQSYPLADGTNRNGITHGAYADSEYGKPINFYKTITAVDFLTFISSLSTPTMSGFAPDRTAESRSLAAYYRSLKTYGRK